MYILKQPLMMMMIEQSNNFCLKMLKELHSTTIASAQIKIMKVVVAISSIVWRWLKQTACT
jgi:hypothetical protein